jgi:DNA-binding transcriptional MerR regulator
MPLMNNVLPPIPPKRYFTIGEVADLCGVKPHVLRYWEQEFTQLSPVKRRGNRRYYQHHEVLMIRRIRDLLYEQGFTIHGARNRLQELSSASRSLKRLMTEDATVDVQEDEPEVSPSDELATAPRLKVNMAALRAELKNIRDLLTTDF